MKRTRYFSFFGEVRLADEVNHKAFHKAFDSFYEEWIKEYEAGDVEDYAQDVDYPALRAALDDLTRDRKVLMEQSDSSTIAAAWQWTMKTAILAVWNDWAHWCEVDLVKFPLEFVAPAAIAGSCCAPRYGLEKLE